MKMKHTILFFSLTILGSSLAQDSVLFDRYFIDKTMRLDYFHTGTHDKEVYSYDEIFQEPVWAGSKVNIIDTLNLGKYLFKVYDIQTNELIYSRGFSSVFGEWQTVGEALKGVWRTFSESIRFPWPRRSVKITIGTRDRYNVFYDDWAFIIDPREYNIRKTDYFPDTKVIKLIHNGDSHTRVDLVILPDGYTKREMSKFRKDAERLLSTLFNISPFKERKKDFNVWAVEVPSEQSGIDDPRTGKYVDKNRVKWQDLMDRDTPIPTPWDKQEYEAHQNEYSMDRQKMIREDASQSQLESLSKTAGQWVHDHLRNQQYWGKVGVFQGASYASEGLYRPFPDCIMFTKTLSGFDPVCKRAIENVIDFYAK